MLKLIIKNSNYTKCILITEISLFEDSGKRKYISVITAGGHQIEFKCSSNEKTIALFDGLVENDVYFTDDYRESSVRRI